MSVKIMTSVFENSKTRGAARLVLLSLADNANDEGFCRPAVATLARKANASEITTREYLHAFAQIGLVKIVGRATDDGRQTSNEYQIIKEKIGSDEITGEILASVRCASRQKALKNSPLTRLTPSDPPSNPSYPTPSNPSKVTPSNPSYHEPNTLTNDINLKHEDQQAQAPVTLTPQQAMIAALCSVMGLDETLNGSKCSRFASDLIALNVTPAQIMNAYGPLSGWYKHDWRGKKGEYPNIATMKETLKRAGDGWAAPGVKPSGATIKDDAEQTARDLEIAKQRRSLVNA